MKRSTLILAVVLPAMVAVNSAAQIMTVRAFAPVNPVSGLPKLLPSPMTGPLAGTVISLPSLVPTLTPAPALLAAAAALPAYNLPASMPSHRLPLLPSAPSHENVINPVRRIMPGVVIRFAAPQTNGSKGSDGERTRPTSKKDELDQIFDNSRTPKPSPIGNERRISLPEDDLLRELGF
jgi:hypothetical protein